jgi:ribonucleoside-triphosphate reductase
MSLQELKKYTFRAKYANYNEKTGKRETWHECVSRSEHMMLEKYKEFKIDNIIKEAYSAVKRKEILGSQRTLQFAGEPILRKNERAFNCCASYADRPRFFQECMFLLLCGCGTGFSVQKHHINKLPNLVSKSGVKTFVIPDTIEGWADAIGILVNSYFDGGIYPEYEGYIVHFDYTKIRPAGSNLSYTTGKAPGPEPLKNSIEKIRNLLDNAIKSGQDKLKPIQVYDIIMHSSDAVLAGGVRRSACICLFSIDDKEMMQAKTGNWLSENPQRARSNNSVVLLKNEVSREKFQEIMKNTKEYGEPGFAWMTHPEGLYNPCFEIGFWAYHVENPELFDNWYKNNYNNKIECQPEEIGLKSGWEFCNLSTINGGKCDTKEKFLEACKQAAIIGTLQAGLTDFPYLGEITEKIAKRESLIGVSITGIMENADITLDEQIQRIGADLIIKTNEELAEKININPAARTTCVKPEGTSSCVLGTSSGIHPHHAKKYFRRIQATKLEGLYQYFKKINPYACEASVWSTNDTDDVITFCIEVPKGSRTKNQLSAIELLKHVQLTQQNWVKYGKTDRSTQPWLTHNVSNTVTVKPEEWDEVTEFIYDNREDFCGISLLPDSGDKDYPQAPFTKVFTPQELLETYGNGAFFSSGLIQRALELYEDNLWKACDVLLNLGDKPRGEAKVNWIESCKKYASRYLEGDIKRLTYLMKDVHNWKLWLDLQLSYKEVNYDEFYEDIEDVSINHNADSACSGNSCEIIYT